MGSAGLTVCWLRWLWLSLLLLLGACGGGGGGDSANTGGALRVSFNTTSVSLQVTSGAAPGSGQQIVLGTATGGSGSESLFFAAELIGPGLLTPLQVTLDTVARTGRLEIRPDSGLPPGTYTGTLRLRVCLDALCASQVSGSPFTLGFTVTVTPRLEASVAALDFTAPETVAAAAQQFDVTLPAGATAATASVDYGAGPADWLLVTRAGNHFTVQPSGLLSAGSYSATLRLDVGDPAQALALPVRLQVSAGLSLPANLALAVNSETAAAATRGSVPVAAAPGAQIAAWTARSSVPWLVLDSASGAPGASIDWHLDTAAVDALANGAVHGGSLVVEAGGGTAPVILPVALDKRLAELRGLDGAALVAGEAGELLLYGERFEQFGAAAASRVAIAGVAPVSVTRLGGRLLSLQLPALVAGRYAVTLQSAAGFATRALSLEVPPARDFPPFAAAMTQATTGLKGAMVWDAVSGSAFVHNRSASTLMRFQTSVGAAAAVSVSERVVPGLVGIGLSADRRSVLALTATGTLLEIDPADLSTRRSTETGLPAANEMVHFPLMASGDNQVWFSGDPAHRLIGFDLLLGQSVVASSEDGSALLSPYGLASGNGRRLLAVAGPASFGRSSIVARDSADGLINRLASGPAPGTFNRASSNRNGTRWVLDNASLRDGDLAVLGLLQPPAGWLATQSAVSRDGSRSYLFTRDAFRVSSRIYVFDTGVTPGPGGAYPVLGYLEPVLNPSCSNEIQNADCDGFGTRMVLSDDDRTLFVVGDRNFSAVPVSQPLRGTPLPPP